MTTSERRRAGRLLLCLLGPRHGEAQNVSTADWANAARLAREHRLGPQLHGRIGRIGTVDGFPSHVAAEWAEAFRANALTVLAQRQAMVAAQAVLLDAGIAAVALKGAVLAWTVWPAPAERIMRDLDLLVPEERAVEAYRVLRANGWSGPDRATTRLDRIAREETHLPPLVSPHGVALELHAHVWRSSPFADHAMPPCDSAAFMDRAVWSGEAGAYVPAANDMLAHLVVHAACSHLFNVGPLAVADVDYWLRAHPIDWPAFWTRARRDGFARAAALVLALTDRWRTPGLLDRAQCLFRPDETVIDEAETLLFQRVAARKDINLIAGLRSRVGTFRQRVARHPLDHADDKSRGSELARRSLSLVRSLANRSTRESGFATHRIARWMRG